ncbi:MAG: copper ion binding protein, partial [Candidatus Izemoplasmatales bacterium]|nr:copper ion binding protein [Candidatus Izemoplasmatales bacterium]
MSIIKKTYKLSGMSCASCALSVESYLSTSKGISSAKVNFANEKLVIEYDELIIDENKIFSLVKQLGYEVITENTNETINFLVEGMSCSSCARTIEETLKKIDGISEFNLNLVNNKLSLKYDKLVVKASQIQSRIDEVG